MTAKLSSFELNSMHFTRKEEQKDGAKALVLIILEPLGSKSPKDAPPSQHPHNFIWKEKYDKKSQRAYYINLKTKKSAWHLPKRTDFSKEELGIIDAYVVRRKQSAEELSPQPENSGSTALKPDPSQVSAALSIHDIPEEPKAPAHDESTTATSPNESKTSPTDSVIQSHTPTDFATQSTDSVVQPILEKIQNKQSKTSQIGLLTYHKVVFDGKKPKIFFLEQGKMTSEYLFQEIFSKEHNRSYYKNMSTKATSWKLPKGISPVQPVSPKNKTPPVNKSETSEQSVVEKSIDTHNSSTPTSVNNTRIHDGIIFEAQESNNSVTLVVKGQRDAEFSFKEKLDPKTKRTYYINLGTKKSMWKLPSKSSFDLSKIQSALAENNVKEGNTADMTERESSALEPTKEVANPSNHPSEEGARAQAAEKDFNAHRARQPAERSLESAEIAASTLTTGSLSQSTLETEQLTHNGVIFERTVKSGLTLLRVKGTTSKKYKFRQKFDQKSQRQYYINLETKKSMWKLPQFTPEEKEMFKQAQNEALSVGTSEHFDTSASESPTPGTPSTPRQSSIKQGTTTTSEFPDTISHLTLGTPTETLQTPSTDERTRPAPIVVPEDSQPSEASASSPGGSSASPTQKMHATHFTNTGRPSSFRLKQSPLANSPSNSFSNSPPSDAGSLDFSRAFSGERQKREKDVISSSRSTLTRDNGFSGEAVRGALEDTIDNAIFFRIGAGETRTLVAVEAFLYDDAALVPQQKKKGAHKQSIVVCVARDFSGVYGMFFIDKRVTKAKSTMTSSHILQSFPLVDNVTIRELEEAGHNCKFQLTINDSQCTLLTEMALKNRLITSIAFAVKSYPPFDNVPKFLRRIAAIDFVQTFHSPVLPPDHKIGTGDLVRSLIALKDNKRLDTLRILIRDATERDLALESLTNFLCSPDFSPRTAKNCFQILKELMRTVTPTKKSYLRKKLTCVLTSLMNRDIPQMRQYDIPSIVYQLHLMFNAQEDWINRGILPEVDFTADFYSESTNVTRIKFDKARIKRRNKINNLGIPNGVFVAVFVHTVDNQRVLASTKGNGMPLFEMSRVQFHTAIEQTIGSSEDMTWLCSLGAFSKGLIHRLVTWVKRSKNASVFLRGFIECLSDIVNQHKFVEDLGYLLDYPVQLSGSEQKSVIFLFSQTVPNEQDHPAPKEYQWRDFLGFEHSIYQKLYDIQETARLETLNHNFEGKRWIYSAVAHEQSLKKKVKRGFYVAHLRIHFESDGFSVLISNNNRTLIPLQFVQETIPAPHEWMDLTNRIVAQDSDLTNDFLSGESFIPSQGTRHHECQTLKQRFYRAWHLLAQDLHVEALGELYPMEMIPFDETGKICCCVFYHVVNEPAEKESYPKGKFLWRQSRAFEDMYHQVYNTSVYRSRLESILTHVTKEKELANVGATALDEAFRYQTEELEVGTQTRFDKWWMSMMWMDLVVHFSNMHDSMYSPQDAMSQFYEYVQILHKQRREIIQQCFEGKKWEEIVQHLQQDEQNMIDQLTADHPLEPFVDPVPEVEDWDNIFPMDIETDRDLDEVLRLDEMLNGPTPVEVCKFLVDDIIEDSMIIYFDRCELEECAQVLEGIIDRLEAEEEEQEDEHFANLVELSRKLVLAERQKYKQQIVDMFHECTSSTNKEDLKLSQMELTYDKQILQMVNGYEDSVKQAEVLFQVISGAQNTLELSEVMTNYEIALDNYEFFSECTADGEVMSAEELKSLGVPRELIRTMTRRLPPPPSIGSQHSSTETVRASIHNELVRTSSHFQMVSHEEVAAERRRLDAEIRMQKVSLKRVGKQYQDNFPKYQRGSKLVRF
uniref:WW domain-containing protein n=1 Tax=Percolomonas cosmopolitus TaxID=63605 RepID=A0A7S1KS12_9EUKA|mmetsp:Transcript_4696/g.17642  ORF Transcript_4696/g.17642 Transcript_4696/m.17642 type:complete len:1823 (+) Transcript_4696:257-5725(+)